MLDVAMDKLVQKKFDVYPEGPRKALLDIRKTILKSAESCKVASVHETLKWNEPSYLTQSGSTVRIGWKPESPSSYFVYFHCQTRLIETFKELYGDTFCYEGKRAIVFDLADKVPKKELEHCISLALRYHDIKHLPMLGA